MLNYTNASATQTWFMNDTEPTSTQFSLGTSTNVNGNGDEYIAYIFAGGASTAATARSVDFDGTTDALQLASSSDFAYGSSLNDFTIECWVYPDDNSSTKYIFDHGQDDAMLFIYNSTLQFYNTSVGNSGSLSDCGGLEKGQWSHVAVVRHGGITKVYVNGEVRGSQTDAFNYGDNTFTIGHYGNIVGSSSWDGKISNLRVVKGTAVYTSAFRPPTEPLTSISGTVLLCCNNSSVTGKTTGGTITAHNNVSASTDNPFDDTDGFKFGADSDNLESIIKTSSYIGNGSSTGPEINLGWEPQWLYIKNMDDASTDWRFHDSMRGIVTGDADAEFKMTNDTEIDTEDRLELTSRGFKLVTTQNNWNADGSKYVYMAIRRPDGIVGKLPAAGINALAMDVGNGSSIIPCFDSGFPIDMAISRAPDATGDWYLSTRYTGPEYLSPNLTNVAASDSSNTWDSNVGWGQGGVGTNYQNWMWKRGQGFDVVAYPGDGDALRSIPHSLNQTVEMAWVKRRTNGTAVWHVYHKDLNGGSTPQSYSVKLNSDDAEGYNATKWADTAPTSTAFYVGANAGTNASGYDYLMMLFASANDAEGNPISKVGTWTGDNTSDGSKVITTGFLPRFILIKSNSNVENWVFLDSYRGMGTGNEKVIYLNNNSAQVNSDVVDTSATGFSLKSASGHINANGYQYLYYAHA
tara:strand:- start:23 stop:2092 length:2070 start_codon:yes stop_codon:yes gene_type:complete